MTPSCSYPSSPPSSMKILLACKLLLVPSLTGWLQTSSASTVQKPNFCYLVSNPNWTKFTIQHLPSVMVLQSVPHPQLAILVSSLMPISPFPIRFLHLLARASTTSRISDAYALSLTSVQPTSLAHHSCIQSSITATHCTVVKNTVNSSPAYPEFSCSCRRCSCQVFWSWPDSQISPLA